MKPITTFEGIGIPLDRTNVDTDQIIPARFLRKLRRDGFSRYCFYDLRYTADGTMRPDFPFNDAQYRDASVLVADSNFGCGS